MPHLDGLKILFVAGFGPLVREPAKSKAFYADTLGLPLDPMLSGVRHFALWPLAEAAKSCFGTDEWPASVQIPQSWLEFDVENVESATATLRERGYALLVEARKEPWGQTVTRMLSPEGVLIGITFTPWLR
jgi:catechol 2,3-dioxygenase-like lactoylglutathione lyase family enzyme